MLFRIMLYCPVSEVLVSASVRSRERFSRRRLKNVSINRPETTNLNHQYAIRRVFIAPALATDRLLTGPCQPTHSAGADDGL